MRYADFRLLFLTFVSIAAGGQTPTDSSEPVRVGPGVIPPRLTHKIEPEYSSEARANRVQGTVIFQIVVNEKGRAVDISVISPLGFGLDEQAQTALEKWEFEPGTRAGVPVKILATVEVNFRFQGLWFDENTERQRTAFNVSLKTLNQPNATPAAVDRAVQSVTDLSRRKFAPAMYLIGSWKLKGEHGPKDVPEGLDLVRKAAAKNYAPAIYEIAARRIEGIDLARDKDKGLQEMREAAMLGSRQAQFYLGSLYDTGDGQPREPDRARRYFRLCAAQGVALCQYRLGRLLYDAAARRERDYLQAIALFQLAAEQNFAEAKPIVSIETPKLTDEQSTWVASLKRQIVRK